MGDTERDSEKEREGRCKQREQREGQKIITDSVGGQKEGQ